MPAITLFPFIFFLFLTILFDFFMSGYFPFVTVQWPAVRYPPPPDFMLLIVFSSTFISTGFETCAFIPAARECWMSSVNALAVMAIIGTFLFLSSPVCLSNIFLYTSPCQPPGLIKLHYRIKSICHCSVTCGSVPPHRSLCFWTWRQFFLPQSCSYPERHW